MWFILGVEEKSAAGVRIGVKKGRELESLICFEIGVTTGKEVAVRVLARRARSSATPSLSKETSLKLPSFVLQSESG